MKIKRRIRPPTSKLKLKDFEVLEVAEIALVALTDPAIKEKIGNEMDLDEDYIDSLTEKLERVLN